jgi:hypothetical protein
MYVQKIHDVLHVQYNLNPIATVTVNILCAVGTERSSASISAGLRVLCTLKVTKYVRKLYNFLYV